MLAVAGLLACALIIQNISSVPPTREDTFAYVCYEIEVMYDVACDDLVAPIVVYSEILDRRFYGVYYWDEPYIFVRKNASEELTLEIILHETTHYVMWELDIDDAMDTCEKERVARVISGGAWDWDDKRMYGCE